MVATKKQKENLRPAKPGEVRNPKGRKKGTLNFKTIYNKILAGNTTVVINGRKVKKTRAEVIASLKVKAAMNQDLNPIDMLRAADSIENRVDGKPEQPISAPAHTPVYITFDKDDAEL
ncbi:MAG: hypothetical protein KAV87_57845 [Desulfobacteraceae bacterium]|nr:hypothetical protein [Desulfobacteraceae bacterium]